MSRRLTFSLLGFALFFQFQCGGSSGLDSGGFGRVPGSWSKYMAVGSVSATLEVFNENGKRESKQELSVDLATGSVSSPSFKLPLGENYRFIVTFYYFLNSSESIPYAYADFTWLVDEFSESVVFTENDIRYATDPADDLIAADLADGIIPDLDFDEDGWSNWEEIRDKVNPKDSGSVPISPTVEVTAQQDGSTATATITVVARDNAHVEEIRMVEPICGISILSDQLVENVDGSVTRTLQVRLDLLSVPGNQRNLQALASDGVTPGQNANGNLNFTVSGVASRPYFTFTQPEVGSEVEGLTVFQGIACSRQPIDPRDIAFKDNAIDHYQWSKVNGSNPNYLAVKSESVDTSLLPDGAVTLTVLVRDANNQAGEGSGVYQVSNDSQIRVVQPKGRRWIFGNEQVAVSVKNLPDTNIVVIEGSPFFTLTSSTNGGAVGTLKVSGLDEGTVIPLTVKAVRSDGTEVTREIEFTVRNKPQVTFQTKARQVFHGWSTEMTYEIVNVDPNQINVEGESTQGFQSCQEDSGMPGVTVCRGEYPVKITASQNFDLTAKRSATADEVCGVQCEDSQSQLISRLSPLSPDIPEINVPFGTADDEPSLARLKVPSSPSGTNYHVSLTNLRDGGVEVNANLQSGQTVTFGSPQELEPLTDHLVVLQRLTGPGGNVIEEMIKEVTTGDLGLVGWWRFKNMSFPGQDSSGRSNHGVLSGSNIVQGQDDWALEFDDLGERFTSPINGFNPTQGTLIIWFLPYFDPFALENGANDQIASLINIGAWNIDSVRLFYSQSGGYCPNKPTDALSICAQVHGSPAPGEPISGAGVKGIPSAQDWNFVAMTWESGSSVVVNVYSSVSNNNLVPRTESFTTNFFEKKLSLGYSGTSSNSWPDWAYWYRGLIQNVSGYNRSLSAEEISSICNQFKPGGCF